MHVYPCVVETWQSESHVTCSRCMVCGKKYDCCVQKCLKQVLFTTKEVRLGEESQSAELPSLIHRGRCARLLVDLRLAAPPEGGRSFAESVPWYDSWLKSPVCLQRLSCFKHFFSASFILKGRCLNAGGGSLPQ